MGNEWGHGGKFEKFDETVMDDGTRLEIGWGEHPHSRSDDRMYARLPSGEIEAFDGHRVLVQVTLRTMNYLKCSSLSGNEVRKGGWCLISFNGNPVRGFFLRDATYGLRRAADEVEKFMDHNVRWWAKDFRDDLIGRRVYWNNQPAKITQWLEATLSSDARLIIEGDPGPLTCAWHDEPEQTIVTDALDPHIWWWREHSDG
jgi:hypothetical protein